MLVLKLTMLEGRSHAQKRELTRRVAESAAQHFDVPLGEVRVILYEVPPTHWSVGGKPLAEGKDAPL